MTTNNNAVRSLTDAIRSCKFFTLKETTRVIKDKSYVSTSAVATTEGKTAVKKAVADLLQGKGDGLVPVMSDLGLNVTANACFKAFLTACKAVKSEDGTGYAVLLRGEGVCAVAKLIPVMYGLLRDTGDVQILGKAKNPTLRERLESAEKKASNLEKLLAAHPELAKELL